MAEALRLLVKKDDDERIRKGRPPHRPRRSGLGERVEARIARGDNPTEAREAVAKEMRKPVKTVAQAHRRWLKRNTPVMLGRK